MTTAVQPSATDVGTMYDSQTDLLTDIMGGFIHVGYWETPGTAEETVETATERLTREVADRLSLSRGDHILDIGCGTGKSAAQIAESSNVKITGITISNYQLQAAETKYEELIRTGKVIFTFADAMNLSFLDASFDGAYAIESLVHMDDRNAALSNIARVLRPGGRISIADLVLDDECPNPEVLASWHELFQVAPLPSGDELKRLLHNNGFRILDYKDVRDNVRPICKYIREKGNSVDGDVGEKLLEIAHVMETTKELGYVFITAERI